jgi:hypothetical protein
VVIPAPVTVRVQCSRVWVGVEQNIPGGNPCHALTVPWALSSDRQATNLSVSRQPTSSKTHYDSPYSPRSSISSSRPRLHEESCSCRLNDAGTCQSNEQCCSVKKVVNERLVAPMVPLLEVKTGYSPCSQDQMCSNARFNSRYGPQSGVMSTHPRLRRLDEAVLCQSNQEGRSVKENVSHPHLRHLDEAVLCQSNQEDCSVKENVSRR